MIFYEDNFPINIRCMIRQFDVACLKLSEFPLSIIAFQCLSDVIPLLRVKCMNTALKQNEKICRQHFKIPVKLSLRKR